MLIHIPIFHSAQRRQKPPALDKLILIVQYITFKMILQHFIFCVIK